MFKKLKSGITNKINLSGLAKMFICLPLAYTVSLTPVYAQQIITDGNTNTSLNINGSITDVTTTTIKGTNAFNSFSKFNVDADNKVNLVVPDSSENLINIVKSQQTQINGTLNSIKNGAVGGNIFLVNPNGIVVGYNGVVNVGSLTAVTPTKTFTDNFFTSPGNPADASVTALINGTAPVNADAVINVQGKINAITDVKIDTGTFTNSGEIYSGAVFKENKISIGDVVNVNTLNFEDQSKLILENGEIKINATNVTIGFGDLVAKDIFINPTNSLNIGKDIWNSVRIIASNQLTLNGGDIFNYGLCFNPGQIITKEFFSDFLVPDAPLVLNSKNNITLGNLNNIKINDKGININDISLDSEQDIYLNCDISITGDINIRANNIRIENNPHGNLHNITANNINISPLKRLGISGGNIIVDNKLTLNAGDIENNGIVFYPTSIRAKELESDFLKPNSPFNLSSRGYITVGNLDEIFINGSPLNPTSIDINSSYKIALFGNISSSGNIKINALKDQHLTSATISGQNIELTASDFSIMESSLITPGLLTLKNESGNFPLDFMPTSIIANSLDSNFLIPNSPIIINASDSIMFGNIDNIIIGGNKLNPTNISINSTWYVHLTGNISTEGDFIAKARYLGMSSNIKANNIFLEFTDILTIIEGDFVANNNFTIKSSSIDYWTSINFVPGSLKAKNFINDFLIINNGILEPSTNYSSLKIGNLDHILIDGNPLNLKGIKFDSSDLGGLSLCGDISVDGDIIINSNSIHLHGKTQNISGNIIANNIILNPLSQLAILETNIEARETLNINMGPDQSDLHFAPTSIKTKYLESNFLKPNSPFNLSLKEIIHIGNLDNIYIDGYPLNPTEINLKTPLYIELLGDISTTGSINLEADFISVFGNVKSYAYNSLLVNNDGTIDPSSNISATTSGYINVNDVITSSQTGGNINIITNGIYDDGTLKTVGPSSEINITNNSALNLTTNKLISDGGGQPGHIYVNGVEKTADFASSDGTIKVIKETGPEGTKDINISSTNPTANVTIAGDILSAGGDVKVDANNKITVDNATISTRNIGSSTDYANALSDGNSGNLTLTAPKIFVQNYSNIYTQADNGYIGGDVILNADATALTGVSDASATAKIEDSTIKANNINLIASAGDASNSSGSADASATIFAKTSRLISSGDIIITSTGGISTSNNSSDTYTAASAYTNVDHSTLTSNGDIIIMATGGKANIPSGYNVRGWASSTASVRSSTLASGDDIIITTMGGTVNSYSYSDKVIFTGAEAGSYANVDHSTLTSNSDIIIKGTGGAAYPYVDNHNGSVFAWTSFRLRDLTLTSSGDIIITNTGGVANSSLYYSYVRAEIYVQGLTLTSSGDIIITGSGGTIYLDNNFTESQASSGVYVSDSTLTSSRDIILASTGGTSYSECAWGSIGVHGSTLISNGDIIFRSIGGTGIATHDSASAYIYAGRNSILKAENSIQFEATATQPGQHASVYIMENSSLISGGFDSDLIINPDGTIDPSSNISATTSGYINVNDVITSSQIGDNINITASNIYGNGTLKTVGPSGEINITNNSALNLRTNKLISDGGGLPGHIYVNGVEKTADFASSDGTIKVIKETGPEGTNEININNNTASNVNIAGTISGNTVNISNPLGNIVKTGSLIQADDLNITANNITNYLPLNVGNTTNIITTKDCLISGVTGNLTATTGGKFYYQDILADDVNINSVGIVRLYNGTISGNANVTTTSPAYSGPAEIALGFTDTDLTIGGNLNATTTQGNIFYYGGSVGGSATFNAAEAYDNRISTALGRFRPLDITGDLNVNSAGNFVFYNGSICGNTTINTSKLAGLLDVDVNRNLDVNALAFGYFGGTVGGDINITAPYGALIGAGELLAVTGNVNINSASGPVGYYLGSVGNSLNITASDIVNVGNVNEFVNLTFDYNGVTYDVNDLPSPIPVDNNDFYVGNNLDIVTNGIINFEGDVESVINASASGDIKIKQANSETEVNNVQSANGDVYLETPCDLIILANGNITGNNIVLNSTGGNFKNYSDENALIASDGRWLVYTADPASTEEGSLTYSKLYNKTYADNPPETIPQPDNYMLYSLAPTLTITADDKNKTYGDANPVFTYLITGLVDGDTESSAISGTINLTTDATQNSDVGNYAINTALSSDIGYQINYVNGVLTIDPANLTIKGNDASRPYGTFNPPFSVNYEGFVLSEDPSVLGGTLHINTPATITSPAGNYDIIPSGLTSGNYNITYLNGLLNVIPVSTDNPSEVNALVEVLANIIDQSVSNQNLVNVLSDVVSNLSTLGNTVDSNMITAINNFFNAGAGSVINLTSLTGGAELIITNLGNNTFNINYAGSVSETSNH